MSLINQMLQDLEKRRASSAERGVLPQHVRALPRSETARRSWLVVASGAVAALAVLTWYFFERSVPQHAPAAAPAVQVSSSPAAAAKPALSPPATTAPVPVSGAVAPASAMVATIPGPAPIPISVVITPDPPVSGKTMAPVPVDSPEARKGPSLTAEPMPRTPAAPAPGASSAKRAAPVVRPEEKSQPTSPNAQIDKRTRQLTPQQIAENEYRDGANLLGQGQLAEAQEKFKAALHHHAGHVGARQGLFGLLVQATKMGEAEQVLQEGLQLNTHEPGFAMALARMQVDRGDTTNAIETLQKTAADAVGNPDYLAFLAALLQRRARHVEAVDHYQAALALAPGAGVWHMGLAISLQTLNRTAEAREAFRRAQASDSLNPELQAFVAQRLRQLQ